MMHNRDGEGAKGLDAPILPNLLCLATLLTLPHTSTIEPGSVQQYCSNQEPKHWFVPLLVHSFLLTHQPANKLTNQPTNQPTNQTTNQTMNKQSSKQSKQSTKTNQPTNQPRAISPAVWQPANKQPNNATKTINQTSNQPINRIQHCRSYPSRQTFSRLN
jgi:hypothetical protein